MTSLEFFRPDWSHRDAGGDTSGGTQDTTCHRGCNPVRVSPPGPSEWTNPRLCVPQSAAEYVSRKKELAIHWFRIDLLRETPEQAVKLVEQYRRVIDGTDDGRQTWMQLKAVNQLGVTRGTLNLL